MRVFSLVSMFWATCTILQAQEEKPLPTENDYYPLLQLPIPEGVVLEASAIEMMPNNKLAVASRRGDIYVVNKPLAETREEFELETLRQHPVSLLPIVDWVRS